MGFLQSLSKYGSFIRRGYSVVNFGIPLKFGSFCVSPDVAETLYDITIRIFTMTRQHAPKILIEVMYKADYCLPCLFMDEAVREIMPKYDKYAVYRRVYFMKGDGKTRFLELSRSLFGNEGVDRHFRLAPVPSLFINGELFFDAIPPKFELEEAIEEVLMDHGLLDKN
jgi:hypothetical protein